MRLAIDAYAHQRDVNAYRLTVMTTNRMVRFAAPKMTMSRTFEKNSEPHVAITYRTASSVW